MDHVVYLDYKAKELEKLRNGSKTMIIRGAMGRKIPYGRLEIGDSLYFIENKGDGLIKATALVSELVQSEALTKEDSIKLVENNQAQLHLDNGLFKRFAGKRYLMLISIEKFRDLESFPIDKSAFSNMDDWLPVGDIEKLKLK